MPIEPVILVMPVISLIGKPSVAIISATRGVVANSRRIVKLLQNGAGVSAY